MRLIILLLFSLVLFGCANLTHNVQRDLPSVAKISKSLKVAPLELTLQKVDKPMYVYGSDPMINTKIVSVEMKDTTKTAFTDKKPDISNEQKVSIKQEKNQKSYQPEFDVSLYFERNKTLRLSYNVTDDISNYNVPVKINERVNKYIERFTTTSRAVMQRWINNSYKYIFYIKDLFNNYGLPTDLSYLPLAESGFDPIVRSRAGAVGMWQFMEHTGKLYGLKVNYWVDERKDFEKSTDAAARHLKDLYEKFGDWNLALAAYNAGAGRIQRAIDKYNTEDYFELSSYRHLAEETKDYVPKYTALMIIHKNLLQYGFEYPSIDPIVYEKVKLDMPVNLLVLSKLVGLDMNSIIDLNPSLRRWITPPNDTFELKVPLGYKDKIVAALNEHSPEELLQVKIYTPTKKENIKDIAKRHKVSADQITAMNGFKRSYVKAGFPVLIPSENTKNTINPEEIDKLAKISDVKEINSVDYVVKKGDSLAKIAKRFKTSVSSIQQINNIKNIKVGMTIEVPLKGIKKKAVVSASSKKGYISYKVKKGDTIYKLAAKYDTEPKEIIKINNLKVLKPGQTIKIPKS
ncbi:MAG: LysM peptidoglycan-binding domain-containing protein [Calditerrivibrio sp.]|nr:LysM peptidoglycan-binding domain-containing protein [Calditerrivibrio sp.]